MPQKPIVALTLLVAAAGCGERAAPSPAPLSDAAAVGQKYFGQCAICHSAEAPGGRGAAMNLIGPSLYGVVGRPSASLAGYSYSPAMRAANLVWDVETLDRFLKNPQALVPGSRMSFAGEADAERRRTIIEFLKSRE